MAWVTIVAVSAATATSAGRGCPIAIGSSGRLFQRHHWMAHPQANFLAAFIHGDFVQPRPKEAWELVLAPMLPNREEYFLEQFFRPVLVEHHSSQKGHHRRGIPAHQDLERLFLSAGDIEHQEFVR